MNGDLVRAYLAEHGSSTAARIADELGESRDTVRKTLRELEAGAQVRQWKRAGERSPFWKVTGKGRRTAEARDLVLSLPADDARDALLILLGMPDPARRWALEAVALASPRYAARARALKAKIAFRPDPALEVAE